MYLQLIFVEVKHRYSKFILPFLLLGQCGQCTCIQVMYVCPVSYLALFYYNVQISETLCVEFLFL